MTHVVVDPVTRIEGHLRIEAEVNGGKVENAWSSSTMFRGIELILKGRDPRDAWVFTQRICGVCTTVHAIASVRAVENALGLEIPLNAQLVRNLLVTAHALHDHVVHFYQLSALDWVDVTQVLKADPAKAASIAESLSDWPGNSKNEMKAVQQKIKALVESGQLGIFAHGYWGHPAMKLPPEINLIAVAHYLQALEYQRYANQVVAMLGGKTPHIQNVDVPDVCAVAGLYPEWFGYGKGVTNYLSVPDLPLDEKSTKYAMAGGYIPNGDLGKYTPIKGQKDEFWRKSVTEDNTHAYYT